MPPEGGIWCQGTPWPHWEVELCMSPTNSKWPEEAVSFPLCLTLPTPAKRYRGSQHHQRRLFWLQVCLKPHCLYWPEATLLYPETQERHWGDLATTNPWLEKCSQFLLGRNEHITPRAWPGSLRTLRILRSPRFLYLTQRHLVAQYGEILQLHGHHQEQWHQINPCRTKYNHKDFKI